MDIEKAWNEFSQGMSTISKTAPTIGQFETIQQKLNEIQTDASISAQAAKEILAQDGIINQANKEISEPEDPFADLGPAQSSEEETLEEEDEDGNENLSGGEGAEGGDEDTRAFTESASSNDDSESLTSDKDSVEDTIPDVIEVTEEIETLPDEEESESEGDEDTVVEGQDAIRTAYEQFTTALKELARDAVDGGKLDLVNIIANAQEAIDDAWGNGICQALDALNDNDEFTKSYKAKKSAKLFKETTTEVKKMEEPTDSTVAIQESCDETEEIDKGKNSQKDKDGNVLTPEQQKARKEEAKKKKAESAGNPAPTEPKSKEKPAEESKEESSEETEEAPKPKNHTLDEYHDPNAPPKVEEPYKPKVSQKKIDSYKPEDFPSKPESQTNSKPAPKPKGLDRFVDVGSSSESTTKSYQSFRDLLSEKRGFKKSKSDFETYLEEDL